MAEPDHIIVKPIPNLSKDGLGAAFPFFYIEPQKYESTLRKFFPEDKGPITNIDPIGNSPVIIEKASLKKIAPTWMNVSLAMKKDPEADKAFGWVLEMYAYAVASALHDVTNILYKDFMIQPPWDLEVGKKFIIHYTYGCDYDMKGKSTYGKIGEWRFDKRSFQHKPPPRNLPLPPPGVPESVVTLVKMVNEATANIPDWDAA
ncbi:Hydroxyproline O-arabinosyltransferase 1 [Asimina triloba]